MTRSAPTPLSRLQINPVVNEVVGDQPVVMTYDAMSRTAVAYYRCVSGQLLTFDLAAPGVLVDRETQTRWTLVSGRAVSGSLSGHQLAETPSIVALLRAWQDFFPESTYYG